MMLHSSPKLNFLKIQMKMLITWHDRVDGSFSMLTTGLDIYIDALFPNVQEINECVTEQGAMIKCA